MRQAFWDCQCKSCLVSRGGSLHLNSWAIRRERRTKTTSNKGRFAFATALFTFAAYSVASSQEVKPRRAISAAAYFTFTHNLSTTTPQKSQFDPAVQSIPHVSSVISDIQYDEEKCSVSVR